MPPIIVGIAVGAAAGGFAFGTVTAAVIGGVVGGALMAGAGAMGKPKIPSATYSAERPRNTASTVQPVQLVYGSVGMAGNFVQSTRSGKASREIVVGLGEGPLNGVRRIRYNEKDFDTIAGDALSSYVFVAGADDETAPSAVTFPGIHAQGKVIAYRNTASLWAKILGKDNTAGGQHFLITVEGIKCWDLATQSARSFTRNPAVIAATYLHDQKGIDWTDIDTTTFQTLETFCGACFDETEEYSQNLMGAGLISADEVNGQRAGADFAASNVLHDNEKCWSSLDQTCALTYDFGENCGMRVSRYQLVCDATSGGYKPSTWKLQGSNNGTDWTDLDTQTTYAWPDNTEEFDVDPGNIARYRYYRLAITAATGNHVNLEKWKLFGFLGSNVPRYVLDYVFDTYQSNVDIEKIIGNSFNGKIIKSQGKWKPVWLHTGDAIFSFTKSNVQEGSFSAGEDEIPNTVRVTYRDRARDFNAETVTVVDHYDVAVRGENVVEEKCDCITDREAAMRRARFLYDYKRMCPGWVKLSAGQYASHLEEYDIVDVTHPRGVADEKKYFVEEIHEDNYGCRSFVLREYEASVLAGGLPAEQNREADPGEGGKNDVPETVTEAAAYPIEGGARLTWTPPESCQTDSFLVKHRCRDQAELADWSEWGDWEEARGCDYNYILNAGEIDSYGDDARIEFVILTKNRYGVVSAESETFAVSACPRGGRKVYALTGDGTDYNPAGISIGKKYIAGSTELYANGRYWIRRTAETEAPDIWQYEEIVDGDDEYTIVRPRSGRKIYNNEPVVINYVPG